jgi:hypothetical protein
MTLKGTKGDIVRYFNLATIEGFVECFVNLLLDGYTVETVEEDLHVG